MKLLGKRILLKAIKKEVLGIEEIDHFEVAYVGDEVKRVKKGDIVIYEQGAKINIEGKEYIELLEDNIVCIL